MSAPAQCKTCDKELGRYNRSGYCTSHVSAANAADPVWRQKQREGAKRALYADPVRLATTRRNIRIHGQLPQAVESRRRQAIDGRIWEKGHAHLAANPEIRVKAGKRQSDTKLAWCPRELRGAYRHLVYSCKCSAAEARELILAEHERDMAVFRRRVASASE